MESCSNQKSVKQIKIFALTALHTIAILSILFSNSLEGVPTYARHLLAAFPSLCGPTHPKPSQFG